VVGFLLVGDVMRVYGRTPDALWWYIQNPDDNNGKCWVWNETTIVTGQVNTIPIIAPSLTPTPDQVILTLKSVVDPKNYTGPCPVNIDLEGTIRTNLPTDVTFRWAADFSYPFVPHTFTFDTAGSQSFHETMTISSSTTGYVRFRVYSPYEVKADKVDINITCVP